MAPQRNNNSKQGEYWNITLSIRNDRADKTKINSKNRQAKTKWIKILSCKKYPPTAQLKDKI